MRRNKITTTMTLSIFVLLLFGLFLTAYERGPITSNDYNNYLFEHVWALVPVQEIVGKFLQTFKEYPPRAKAASFTVDQALETPA